MSYLRYPHYVYRSGETVSVDGAAMPLEWFDAVVAMRWAQMSQEERHAAIRRAIEYGEFGADSLRQTLGLPTQMDSVQKQLDELEHRS